MVMDFIGKIFSNLLNFFGKRGIRFPYISLNKKMEIIYHLFLFIYHFFLYFYRRSKNICISKLENIIPFQEVINKQVNTYLIGI